MFGVHFKLLQSLSNVWVLLSGPDMYGLGTCNKGSKNNDNYMYFCISEAYRKCR